MATNLNLTDMETGYKMFRREVIQKIQIEENRFGFEPEIVAKVSKMDLRIYEVLHFLQWAHLCRRKKDRLARRLQRASLHCQIQLPALATSRPFRKIKAARASKTRYCKSV
jgi:hypothetical protein